MPDYDTTRYLTPRSVTWGSIVVNALMTAAKITAGFLSGSHAIFADGLHSASDMATDVAVLTGLRVANKPADRSHRYGHRRATTLAAMCVGAILLMAGGWIAVSSIRRLQEGATSIDAGLPFWVALASVPVKELLFRATRLVGRRENDLSLLANAWHHRTDAFTSIAAAAGLAGVLLGGPKWRLLDSLTGLVLSAFLMLVAIRIIRTSAGEMMDRAPSDETLAGIERAVGKTQGVRSYHAIRARQVGGKVEMDIHVQVAPELTVREGHDIASQVKHAAMAADPSVVEVIVHIEPAQS